MVYTLSQYSPTRPSAPATLGYMSERTLTLDPDLIPHLLAVCHAEVKPGCEEKMKAKLIEAAAIYKKDRETIDW